MNTRSSTGGWKRIQDHWQVLRPRVAAYWSRFSADELAALPGDRASLVALVKRHYALATTEAEAQVDTWLAGVSREMDVRVDISAVDPALPPAGTKDEQRAEDEGMGVVPGAAAPPEHRR